MLIYLNKKSFTESRIYAFHLFHFQLISEKTLNQDVDFRSWVALIKEIFFFTHIVTQTQPQSKVLHLKIILANGMDNFCVS